MNVTNDLTLLMFNGSIKKSSGHLSVYRIFDSFNAAVPHVMSILCVAISFSNALVLSAFVVNKHLRTPFNMYLINLLVSDLAQSLLDLPFTTMGGFLPIWPLGRKACSFSLYGKWVYSAVVRNTHSLISFNRIWALFFPIHYKQYHSKATAIWLCVATWVYVHLWLLPGLIPDDLYYRLDDGSCQVHQRRKTMPVQGHRQTAPRPRHSRSNAAMKVGVRQTVYVSSGAPSNLQGSTGKTDTPAADGVEDGRAQGTVEEARGSLEHSSPVTVAQRHALQRRHVTGNRSESFAVLTYLVLGVVFCWTPIMVYFTMTIKYFSPTFVNDVDPDVVDQNIERAFKTYCAVSG
ncbi:hypothetical protein RvY_11817 [Ramazzottius varieornatus]|uniref:G-protein coupled receptors family 1 profile domain-containing protein n=1 Tax=Ramazzottius varieornatus TaxID=947166 RepID=A0A1D1VJS4_RAMVA|nr:hypothetical protein RvY_11817 [Ramazzottius varieornatus]